MKREIVVADDSESMMYVAKLLSEGYVLDPTLTRGTPYLLETSTVWPLVFYETVEERPKPETKIGEFDNVVDVIEVQFGGVPDKIKEGYTVQTIYAKAVIMLKRQEAGVKVEYVGKGTVKLTDKEGNTITREIYPWETGKQ